jgi:hypothetical protein
MTQSGKVISKTIHGEVIIGKAAYPSPLTITATGAIEPSAAGLTALLAPASLGPVSVLNAGTIIGGPGATGVHGAGGLGVDLAAGSTLQNTTGTIAGGAGGYGHYGHGGIGVYLAAGGTLANGGKIAGGAGGGGRALGNAGGSGVYLATGGTLVNQGGIQGGKGGAGHGTGGAGGNGVYLTAGVTLSNAGSITGGSGGAGNLGGAGGAGLYVAFGATVTNAGTIGGGTGGSSVSGYGGYGGAGVYVASGGVLTNSGRILGGNGGVSTYPQGGVGAAGVDLANGGTLSNTGTISGGNGGASTTGAGGNGGAGVYLSGGTLITAGTINGGAAGTGPNGTGESGDAVQFGAAAATLLVEPGAVFNGLVVADPSTDDVLALGGTAAATLTGLDTTLQGFGNVLVESGAHWSLTGTYPIYGALTVNGALTVSGTINAGITLGVQGELTNQGGTIASTIYSTGGDTIIDNSGTIASGAAYGVDLAASGKLTNAADGRITGTLTGIEVSGTGGVEIIDSGIIEGGTGGEAIQLGGGNDRLVLNDGFVMVGGADGGGGSNVLELDNSPGSAVLSGLGTSYTNFQTLQVDAGYKWSLTNSNSLGSGSMVQDEGTLSVVGTLTDAGGVTIASGAVLELGGAGTLQIATVALAGGTLQGGGAGVLAVGAGLSGAATGVVTVDSGARLSGFGTVSGTPLVDDGTVEAKGGTLTLASAVSGTGTLLIDSGATVSAGNSLSVATVTFGAGGSETLSLGNPKHVTARLNGFGAGDVIDLRNLTATSLKFQDGTLSLERNNAVVDTLLFAGTYTAANFSLVSDGNGGTYIDFTAAAGQPEPIAPHYGGFEVERATLLDLGFIWHEHF